MKLLTPEHVAESLSVSRSTVLRIIRDGSLPAICLRAGRRKKIFRISADALERWVTAREKLQNAKNKREVPDAMQAARTENNTSETLALARQTKANSEFPSP
jgi:excisionase family DNA binding protein